MIVGSIEHSAIKNNNSTPKIIPQNIHFDAYILSSNQDIFNRSKDCA